jgi:hypothetical protein
MNTRTTHTTALNRTRAASSCAIVALAFVLGACSGGGSSGDSLVADAGANSTAPGITDNGGSDTANGSGSGSGNGDNTDGSDGSAGGDGEDGDIGDGDIGDGDLGGGDSGDGDGDSGDGDSGDGGSGDGGSGDGGSGDGGSGDGGSGDGDGGSGGGDTGPRPIWFSDAPGDLPVVGSLPKPGDYFLCDGVRVEGSPVISGKVVVKSNSVCVLTPGVVIKGHLKIEKGGRLFAQGIEIRGSDRDLYGEYAGLVLLENSKVGDDVYLRSGGPVTLRNNDVGHNIHLTKNTGDLYVLGNYVYNDIELKENKGLVWVEGNQIGDDLHCSNNLQQPVGGDNSVSLRESNGYKTGQCTGL